MNDAPLLVLRVLFGAFVTALLLYLVVLAVVLPFSAPFADPPAVTYLLLVAAMAGPSAARWIASRPLPCGDPGAMLVAYRGRLLLAAAAGETTALTGFVAAFLAGGFWPYLVTLPLGLLALALVAPVERNIAAAEQRVVASGCATSLRAALHGTAGGDGALRRFGRPPAGNGRGEDRP